MLRRVCMWSAYLLHTVPIRHVPNITLILGYLVLIQILVDRHFARVGRFEQPMYITGCRITIRLNVVTDRIEPTWIPSAYRFSGVFYVLMSPQIQLHTSLASLLCRNQGDKLSLVVCVCRSWSHKTTVRIIGIITAVGTVRRPRRFLSWCVCWTCRGCEASSVACLWLKSDRRGYWRNQWLGRMRVGCHWCRFWATTWITTTLPH